MAMIMLLRGITDEKFTVHGFRSVFRDWAGDMTDHPREIAEMALEHSIGSDVEAAYWRGRALEKRRVLMRDWETFLATAPEPVMAKISQVADEKQPAKKRGPAVNPAQVTLFAE